MDPDDNIIQHLEGKDLSNKDLLNIKDGNFDSICQGCIDGREVVPPLKYHQGHLGCLSGNAKRIKKVAGELAKTYTTSGNTKGSKIGKSKAKHYQEILPPRPGIYDDGAGVAAKNYPEILHANRLAGGTRRKRKRRKTTLQKRNRRKIKTRRKRKRRKFKRRNTKRK